MRDSFEVTKLDKGFEISVQNKSDSEKDFYVEPARGIASTDEEVKEYFNKWLESDMSKKFKF